MGLFLNTFSAHAEESAPAATPATPSAKILSGNALGIDMTGALFPASLALAPQATAEQVGLSLPGTVPAHISGGVQLLDSDLLTGRVMSFQTGIATLVSGVAGRIEIPAERIALLITSKVLTARPVDVPADFTGAVLANGERVTGTVSFINDAQVGIDNGKRVIQIPRERVAAAILRAPTYPVKPVVCLRLALGDRLSGVVTVINGAWKLRHALGEWSIPAAQIRGWWCAGPARIAVSGLTLTAAYTDDLQPPIMPVQVDRDADDWLHLGELRCDQGLAMRAGSSISCTIPDGMTSLVTLAGVTDGGSAIFSISLDGKPTFTSAPLARGGRLPLRVPLSGSKRLTLSLVNAKPNDVPTRGIWAWPTLCR